ncbi:MAG: hypothetical protein JJU45_10460 [Acidimicrobiia bacterium]|nr:hypothetical protein [Acidimicrobiia bacterium]
MIEHTAAGPALVEAPERPSPSQVGRSEGAASTRGRGWGAVVAAVALRPTLWPTALRQAVVLAEPGWWRRAPHIPRPDPAYLRFRQVTAYGGTGDDGAPAAEDVVTYLRWCRAWPAASR